MSFGVVEMCDCKCKCRKCCRKPNALSNETSPYCGRQEVLDIKQAFGLCLKTSNSSY